MGCAQIGKEFPDMRQNERRIEFIGVGDTGKTVGWPKGEPFCWLVANFYRLKIGNSCWKGGIN